MYKELLADKKLGPELIGKLKSQGVRQMDDSVMRKEIPRRLQEAFRKNNIEFAHRNVTVYIPSEDEISSESKKQNPTSASTRIQGAATAAILDEEEKIAIDGSNIR